MIELDDGLVEGGAVTPAAMVYFSFYVPRNPLGARPRGFEVRAEIVVYTMIMCAILFLRYWRQLSSQ